MFPFLVRMSLVFPFAKINLGLRLLPLRPDGYHGIDSYLYPIPLYDVLEIFPSSSTRLHVFGLPLPSSPPEDNLVSRAYAALNARFSLPPLAIYLYKNIPAGMGLGGASSDASHMLQLLNDHFTLGLRPEDLQAQAEALGSDCPFFLQRMPYRAQGRGEQLHPLSLRLTGYYLLLVCPSFSRSTAAAYAAHDAYPSSATPLAKTLPPLSTLPLADWKTTSATTSPPVPMPNTPCWKP